MAKEFKLSFQMRTKEGDMPVCFKLDGQRFEQMQTVKLNLNTDYTLKFILRPAFHIEKLMINGEIHKFELVKPTTVEQEQDDARTYVCEYTTDGYTISRNGKRKELLIVLQLENGIYMKVCLQCKIYQNGEIDHSQWGQKLATLDYDCEMEQGHNYVRILKEKYL